MFENQGVKEMFRKCSANVNRDRILYVSLDRSFFKGTVSRDRDVLVVVWMDRALFGDERLTVLKTICCFLVFNFVF
jgi:hypothetical protein